MVTNQRCLRAVFENAKERCYLKSSNTVIIITVIRYHHAVYRLSYLHMQKIDLASTTYSTNKGINNGYAVP